jgi:kynureninase
MASLTTELPTWDTTPEFADAMDAKDPLRSFRDEFHFPVVPDTATHRAPGSKTIYLCGNSLGLQPAYTDKYVTEELA